MLINFRDYFNKICEEKELQNINESVINKIKHLFLLKSPDRVVDEFKKIFNINDDIKISKVDIGGSFNPYTKNITYSTNNSLIHELIHYLQNRNKDTTKDYTVPEFTDEGILKYILQPLELNNWALSLADDAFQYGGLNNFLKIGKPSKDFKSAGRDERIKHIIYLLTGDIIYDRHTKKYKQKFLKLLKEYYFTIKSLKQDINEYKIKEIIDIL